MKRIADGQLIKWHRRVSPGTHRMIFLNGMDTYSFLTGKKRFYKTFVDMADYILRTSVQQELCHSMRWYAIPGFSLMRAYNTTGDKRYLDGAKRVIDTCLRWEKHMPGCFTDKPVYLGYDPIWGNVNYTHSMMYYNYRSAANFMTEYLSRACRDLYVATGDNRYAQVVIGTAEWIWDELVADDLRTYYSTGPGPGYYDGEPRYQWHGVFPFILSSRAFDLTQSQKYFGRARKLSEVVNPELEVFHIYSNSEYFYYMESFMQEKDQ